ncbi:MAG: DUF3078 domain-containing protein [Muribaculaceae bacterium]|nr:DUF3078 domain-containing protein [Muribaculaceae bacterium]
MCKFFSSLNLILLLTFLGAGSHVTAQTSGLDRLSAQFFDVDDTFVTARGDTLVVDTTLFVGDMRLPSRLFGPIVFTGYNLRDSASILNGLKNGNTDPAFSWIDRQKSLQRRIDDMIASVTYNNPDLIPYIETLLPEPPKVYQAEIDPSKAQIVIKELETTKVVTDAPKPVEVERRNWLYNFNGSVQFSQAYVSPNWYQGGNNNLNMIVNAAYNIKLNEAFHPKFLFDNTIRYKLAMNSAPDDTLRNYSISEDLFQINTNFGVKASKHWYYSVTGTFKTQLLNNYATNTNNLKAAFLSPGELNIGVGMTYAYTNPKKTFDAKASIAPLSYNLKICTNDKIDPTLFGIKEGHHTDNQYGSSFEGTINWQLTYNIKYATRLFAFSDYNYFQSDWEHTLSFDINRFLSTQLYLHLRYDSQTPRLEDSRWHTWQVKEILSFGFSYKFATV